VGSVGINDGMSNGQDEKPSPKGGNTVVIAAAVIVAVRTARMANYHAWHPDLGREIDQAVKLAKRILDETRNRYIGLFK